MARWTLAIVATLIGTALALPVQAQAQWKWRDKTGRTQYSDLPPPASVPEQDILSRPAAVVRRAAAAAAAASGTVLGAAQAPLPAGSAPIPPLAAASSPFAPKTVDPELEAKRKKAEADQAAKTKAEEAKIAAARAENCERAKGQLRSLDSGIRIQRVNDKGEREILDDKQRAAEATRTRDNIAADCK
jgi:hypothetical protein